MYMYCGTCTVSLFYNTEILWGTVKVHACPETTHQIYGKLPANITNQTKMK